MRRIKSKPFYAIGMRPYDTASRFVVWGILRQKADQTTVEPQKVADVSAWDDPNV
jgi:hypothetical protein